MLRNCRLAPEALQAPIAETVNSTQWEASMRKLRFGLAVLAVALTSSTSRGLAFESCPYAVSADPPYYTCGYSGHGSCANSNCQYDCGAGGYVVIPWACNVN